MDVSEARSSRRPPASRPLRLLAAGTIGNILEWYDFALYGYLATVFADRFFPAADPTASLIGTYSVFAVGFLARPHGGMFFGRIGDQIGRRRLLRLSIILMGVSTFLMGVLPTYQSVGILAPVLLVALRIVQGISAGGEFSGSIVYLVEHAPARRRGLYGSVSNFGAMLGGLAGAAVAWATTALLPEAALESWGWRIPFLSGIVLAAAGLWLRSGIGESPVFEETRAAGDVVSRPVRAALKTHPKEIVVTALLNWAVSAGYYLVFVWLATDLHTYVGLSLPTALGLSSAGLLICSGLTVLAGSLADRIGPRAVLLITGLGVLFLSMPLFLLAGRGGAETAALAQFGLAVLMAGYLGTLPAVFVSLHGSGIRCTSLSIGYNFATAIFGGTAPLIATALVGATGWQLAPGLYFAAAALLGLMLLGFVPKRFEA